MGVVAAPAAAVPPEPAWTTGLRISPAGSSHSAPAAALAARGEAIAAWTIFSRSSARVQIRTRHGFVSPWRVAWTSGAGGATALAVGANPAGAAVVIWRVPGGPVRSAVRSTRGGRWRVMAVPSRRADPRALRTFVGPEVAVAADGSASALWLTNEGGAWMLRGARRRPGGAWIATPPLAPDANTAWAAPAAHVNASGDAVAAWILPRPGTEAAFVPPGTVRVATRARNGAWSPVATLGESEGGADAAIGSDGGLAVAWTALSESGREVIIARAEAPGSAFSPPEVVAPGSTARIALNGSGAMVAAWAGPGGVRDKAPLQAAVNHGAGWTAPQTLWASSDLGTAEIYRAHIAIGASGRAFLGWVDPEGPGTATAGVSTAASDGVFRGFGQRAPTNSAAIAIAPDGVGNALVLLDDEASSGHCPFDTEGIISAASYDRYRRAVVTGSAHAVRIPSRGTIRWTVTVRNRGPVIARGVRLTTATPCPGSRFVGSAPCGLRLSSRWWRWKLGTMRPGAVRRVRVAVRPGPGTRAPYRLFGDVSAIGVVPASIGDGLRASGKD